MKKIHFLWIALEMAEPGAVTVPILPITIDGAEQPDARPPVDHMGVPSLPGTTVAGSIRAELASRNRDLADRIMGWVKADAAAASPLRVLGTALRRGSLPPDPLIDERSTAIDRHRAAALRSTLRWTQTLPADATFDIYLRWDDPSDTDLAEVLAMLGGWQPFIGRGVTSGRGRARVDSLRHGALDLTEPEGLASFLNLNGPELVESVAVKPEAVSTAPARDEVRFTARIVDGLHIGRGVDEGNLSTTTLRRGVPIVPGRSLRGVFRSRAEFILRSVGVPACKRGSCGHEHPCAICRVFGRGGADEDTNPAVGKRAVVRFLDAPIEGGQIVERTHVGLDRVTGGAHDGLLYATELVEAGSFTVTVQRPDASDRLDASDEEWSLATALARLVAYDIDTGYVGIGGGTTHGQGTVRLEPPIPAGELSDARRVLVSLIDSAPRVKETA